jgi:hypothetical protein
MIIFVLFDIIVSLLCLIKEYDIVLESDVRGTNKDERGARGTWKVEKHCYKLLRNVSEYKL